MSNYIEEYKVLGRTYGIEDFKSPGKHFFDGKDGYSGKPLPRFMVWSGGCGIGRRSTRREAREHLFLHIRERLLHKYTQAKKEVRLCEVTSDALGISPTSLNQFKVNKKDKMK